jgi:cardiolipin synthase
MSNPCACQWICTGQEIFPAMLDAIKQARASVLLETYIYSNGELGRQFLEALVAAATRGVKVRVLVDAVGSWFLPRQFFDPLIAAGGQVRRFNPLHLFRFGVRDHRKLLICDDLTIYIGGFNISDEYNGDGVTSGWCDLGAHLENADLAKDLAKSFEELFLLADFHRRPLMRLRAFKRRRKLQKNVAGILLLSHPGRGASPFQNALYYDLQNARDVRIISAYFLPTRHLRRSLLHIVRQGGRVQLILAGKTDVAVSQLAVRNLYRRLLKAGVEIYEYQPQILHAKLIIADGITYVGSSNLDIRSLNLNYELMVRLEESEATTAAQEIFERSLTHSKKIPLQWWKTVTFWQRWKHRWAHFLLTRIDPFVALQQFRSLK